MTVRNTNSSIGARIPFHRGENEQSTNGDFQDFPDEIILKCLSFLPDPELVKCSLLNRRFLYISRDDSLWVHRFPAEAFHFRKKSWSIFDWVILSKNIYEHKGCIQEYDGYFGSIALTDRYLVGADWKHLRTLDLQTKQWKIVKPTNDYLSKKNLNVSAEQNMIICGNDKGLCGIQLRTCTPCFTKGASDLNPEEFSSCKMTGNLLVTSSINAKIFHVWKLIKHGQLTSVGEINTKSSRPVVGEGVLVDRDVIWDLKTCSIRHKIKGFSDYRTKLFNHCLYNQDVFGNVYRYSLETGEEIAKYGNEKGRVNCEQLVVNEKYILSLGKDNLSIYDQKSCERVFFKEFSPEIVKKCKMAGDRVFILEGNEKLKDQVTIYHIPTGVHLQSILGRSKFIIDNIHVHKSTLVLDKKVSRGGTSDLYMLKSEKFPKLEGPLSPPKETYEERIERENRIAQYKKELDRENQWCVLI